MGSEMSSPIITNIEIRACRGGDALNTLDAVSAVQLPGGSRPDFTVITLTTADGVQGIRDGGVGRGDDADHDFHAAGSGAHSGESACCCAPKS